MSVAAQSVRGGARVRSARWAPALAGLLALGVDVIARLRDSVRLPIAVVLPSDQEDTMHGKHAA